MTAQETLAHGAGNDDTAVRPIDLTPRELAGLIAVMVLAFAAPMTMAFNIGAIITTFGALKAEAGLVATVEGISLSLATIAASRMIAHYSARWLAMIGLALVVSANGLTLIAPDVTVMTVIRAFGGSGTGIVIACVMATAARTSNPEMTFGWINGSVGAFVSVLALAAPWAIAQGGLGGAYGLYMALALSAFLFISFVPNQKAPSSPLSPPSAPAREPAASSPTNTAAGWGDFSNLKDKVGWIALVGAGLLFFSHAGLLAFLARIGAEISISLQSVGFIMFVGGLLTIVGPITAGVVGARFGSTLPAIVVITLICLAVLLLTAGGSSVTFYLSVPLLMVLPAIMLPSFLGGLVALDPSGRLAGAHPGFLTMGGAIGPVVVGAVADATGFMTAGWFVAALCVTALALMIPATLQADKVRSYVPKFLKNWV